MEKLIETLGMAGTLIALAMAAAVVVFIVVWATKNKWKLKGKNGEVFQLGDDTPFEKTNARFKELCANITEVRENYTVVERLCDEMLSVRKTLAKIDGMFQSTHNDVKEMSNALHEVKKELSIVQQDQQKQDAKLIGIEIGQCKHDIYGNAAPMPYVEQVWSAHRYLRLGGNGKVKEYITGDFRQSDPATFDSVWALADRATETVLL